MTTQIRFQNLFFKLMLGPTYVNLEEEINNIYTRQLESV